jgi:hypothetical protein
MVMSHDDAADRELWLRRARDAAIEATLSGATAEQIADQIAEGIREGLRVAGIRQAAADGMSELERRAA